MREKRSKIVEFARQNNGYISKKNAVSLIGHSYFHNAQKHTGDVLSRMVKANILTKRKRGLYKLSSGRLENPDPKQAKLF